MEGAAEEWNFTAKEFVFTGMKTVSSWNLLILLWLSGGAVAAPAPPTQILVLGTLHQMHARNPGYTYEDVARVLETFNPDLVCVEIRPQEFRRELYVTEMNLATVWALTQHKPVYPIDWWLDSPNDRTVRAELEKTTEYKDKAAKLKLLTAASPIIAGFEKKYVDYWKNPKLGYAFWNGTDYDAYITEDYRLSMQIYGDNAMNLHYQSRNQHMLDRVLAALKERPVPKVVVLTGCEHKHFFDRAFRENANLSVVDFASLLPLKEAKFSPAVRDLLEEGNDLPYFESGYPRDLNRYYDLKLVDLLHGPNMDFHPETIPQANVFKAEKVLSRWRSQFPGSGQLSMNLAWYAFLIGDYSKAVGMYQECAAKFDRGEIPGTNMGLMIYQGLGRSYDLTGERQKALASYARVEKMVAGTPFERVKHLLTNMDGPYQQKKVFQPGMSSSLQN